MARMAEEQARKGVVRFFDPRLHRVGFGIEIVLYNPKERAILLYSKESSDSVMPSLSVLPLDETQYLTLAQLYVAGQRVIEEALRNGYADKEECLCSLQVQLLFLREEAKGVSVYAVVDHLNRLIGFLHTKLSWQEVKDIVWSPLSVVS